MTINAQTEKRIVSLARLKTKPEEGKVLLENLNQILEWIEQLKEVKTDHIDSIVNLNSYSLRRRADEINDGDKAEIIVQNAPDAEFNMFAVPKVVE